MRASLNAAPSCQCARGLAAPFRISGETKVASTATCAPRFAGKPLSTTSSLLPSVGCTLRTLRSLRYAWVLTLAPASRPTRAHIRSSGTALVCSTPPVPQAARWSPSQSSVLPHLQRRSSRSKGSRRRLSSKALSFAFSHCSSPLRGGNVKCSPAQRPACERSRAWLGLPRSVSTTASL